MPESDCGICDKLINCSGSLNSKESFQTLVAKLLCEGVDSFAALAVQIGGFGAQIIANTAAIAANAANIVINAAAAAANASAIILLDGRVTTLEGASASAFNWTTSEQTWPFETLNGTTLYAKRVDCGTTFGAGALINTAHGITGLANIHRVWGTLEDSALYTLPWTNGLGDGTSVGTFGIWVDATNAVIRCYTNRDGFQAWAYLIYTKS